MQHYFFTFQLFILYKFKKFLNEIRNLVILKNKMFFMQIFKFEIKYIIVYLDICLLR